MNSESDSAQQSAPLLTVDGYEGVFEFRSNPDGTVAVSKKEFDSPWVQLRNSATLLEAVDAVRALEFDPDGVTVEVTLAPASELTIEQIVELATTTNDEFGPSGQPRDVTGEPPIIVNGRYYYAVEFDDGSWEFVEDAYGETIAEVSMFEPGSMFAALVSFSLQRLPTGHF